MIDYVETNYLSQSKIFHSFKTDIENSCLKWIGITSPSPVSNTTKNIANALNLSSFVPHQKDRPQLKVFIDFIRMHFNTNHNLRVHMAESKFILIPCLLL